MALFKPQARDSGLSVFSPRHAQLFRRLAAQVFAEQGQAATVQTNHVRTNDGRVFGLENIAAICAAREPIKWMDLLEAHVLAVLNPVSVDALSQEEFERCLRARLTSRDTLPDDGDFDYVREMAPGLVAALAVDLPETIATLPERDLVRRGELKELWSLGLGNLLAIPPEDLSASTSSEEGPGRVTHVVGPEFFTASLALRLPAIVALASSEADRGHGIFVSVPTRARLMYRVVDGPDSVGSFMQIFQIALAAYDNEPGALSPHVYWVRDGVWTQATGFVDGRPSITARDQLQAEFLAAGWSSA